MADAVKKFAQLCRDLKDERKEREGEREEKREKGETKKRSAMVLPSQYVPMIHKGKVIDFHLSEWCDAFIYQVKVGFLATKKYDSKEETDVKLVVHRNSMHDLHAQEFVQKAISKKDERETREFKHLSMLVQDQREENHRFLCLPFEMWRMEDTYYMITERHDYDLFEWLQNKRIEKNGPTSFDEIGKILHQVTKGLEILHNVYDMAHNDIKPENVLIDEKTLRCKICDFGGAVMLSDENEKDLFVRTLFYASPERHQRRKCNEKTDIWSLGILAIELRSGTAVTWLIDEDFWLDFLERSPDNVEEFIEASHILRKLSMWTNESEKSNDLLLQDFLQDTVKNRRGERSTASQLILKYKENRFFKEIE